MRLQGNNLENAKNVKREQTTFLYYSKKYPITWLIIAYIVYGGARHDENM